MWLADRNYYTRGDRFQPVERDAAGVRRPLGRLPGGGDKGDQKKQDRGEAEPRSMRYGCRPLPGENRSRSITSHRGSRILHLSGLWADQLESIGRSNIGGTGHAPDRTELIWIDPVIVEKLVADMKSKDFPYHETAPQRFRAHVYHLYEPAFHIDKRLLHARRLHEIAFDRSEAGFLELIDIGREFDRADIHRHCNFLGNDIDDEFFCRLDVIQRVFSITVA